MKFTYINGRIESVDDTKFGPSLFSLNYAVCAFEGIRSYKTKSGKTSIFRLADHSRRMVDSMNYLEMESEFKDPKKIYDAVCTLVKLNGGGDQYIRPIAFYDEGIMSVKNRPKLNFIIMSFPFQKNLPLPPHNLEVADSHSDKSTQNHKISKNYFGSYMALNKIVDRNDPCEVIQYDENNYIMETSAHNIFFRMEGNSWVTPPDDQCLPGITRSTVIDILEGFGTSVQKRQIHLKELSNVKAAFITSTAAEIVKVSAIQGVQLEASREEISKIIAEYRGCVSGDKKLKCEEWNNYV